MNSFAAILFSNRTTFDKVSTKTAIEKIFIHNQHNHFRLSICHLENEANHNFVIDLKAITDQQNIKSKQKEKQRKTQFTMCAVSNSFTVK